MSPIHTQLNLAKAQYPGVLIAIRIGDFYEFWDEDAVTAAKVLEITLTGRNSEDGRIPMSGVPFHSVEKYLAKLLQAGYKVALCDQLEDPKLVSGRPVKRGVTHVLTPATGIVTGNGWECATMGEPEPLNLV